MPKKRVRTADPVAIANDHFEHYAELGMSRPRIVCAANRYRYIDDQGHEKTLIVPGPRHFSLTMRKIINLIVHMNPNAKLLEERGDGGAEIYHEQGFVDQYDNYHCRLVAWVIAETNGQIVRRCGGDGLDGHGLFSENLY